MTNQKRKSNIPKKELWCGCDGNIDRVYHDEKIFITHIKKFHKELYDDFKVRYNMEEK